MKLTAQSRMPMRQPKTQNCISESVESSWYWYEEAYHDGSNNISLRGLLLLRYAAGLSQHVDERDNQATEGNRTK